MMASRFEFFLRHVGPGDYQEPGGVRGRNDGQHVQALQGLVAAVAREDHVECFGNLPAQLFRLAAFFGVAGGEGVDGNAVVKQGRSVRSTPPGNAFFLISSRFPRNRMQSRTRRAGLQGQVVKKVTNLRPRSDPIWRQRGREVRQRRDGIAFLGLLGKAKDSARDQTVIQRLEMRTGGRATGFAQERTCAAVVVLRKGRRAIRRTTEPGIGDASCA